MTAPLGLVVGGPYYDGPGAPSYAVRIGAAAPSPRVVVAGRARPAAARLWSRVVVAGRSAPVPPPLLYATVPRGADREAVAALRRGLDRLSRSWTAVFTTPVEMLTRRVVVAGRSR